MALFKFNYKHRGTAFFFNALFTAVTFAIILVFNDQLDKYLANQHYFHDDTLINSFNICSLAFILF